MSGPPIYVSRNGVRYVKPAELVASVAFRRAVLVGQTPSSAGDSTRRAGEPDGRGEAEAE